MTAKFTLSARMRSVRFALAGVRALLVQEHNARVHLTATLAVVIAGLWLGISRDEWVWALIATALVWFAEAINSAIERLGDAVTTDYHPQVGMAKDMAAAAVLVAAICAALIGLVIFVPYTMRLLP